MKEQIAAAIPGVTVRLNRRNLLCAAAAAGGALIATDSISAGLRAKGNNATDPRLRAALLKYGGEFGQAGKGGSHGDL